MGTGSSRLKRRAREEERRRREDKWGSILYEILAKIVTLTCEPPDYTVFRPGTREERYLHHRSLWGKLRLVNKHWCAVVDSSITVLMPNWKRVWKQELNSALREKFPAVERISFCESRDVFGGRVGRHLASLYARLPIKEVDFSYLSSSTHGKMGREQLGSLTTLTNLQRLDVSTHSRIRSPPPFKYIARMVSLKELDLRRYKGQLAGKFGGITRLTNLTSLHCGWTVRHDNDVLLLGALTSLTHLAVKPVPGGTDVVSNLVNLKQLYLTGRCDSSILGPLTSLTNLRVLSCGLDGSRLCSQEEACSDLHYLARLSLTRLDVWWDEFEYVAAGAGEANGFRVLSRLTSLGDLTIMARTTPRSFGLGLAALSSITRLNLFGVRGHQLKDNMGSLASMPNLRVLCIAPSSRPAVPLGQLTQLVNLTSLCLKDVARFPKPLKRLPRLQHLYLYFKGLNTEDALIEISEMKRLKSLHVGRLVGRWYESYGDQLDRILTELQGLFSSRLSYLNLILLPQFGRPRPRYTEYTRQVLREHPSLFLTLR